MPTVFRSELYQVDLFEGDGDKVVVTFTEAGHRSLTHPGFGTSFLLKSGFSVVAVKSSRDRWYSDAPAELFAEIRALLERARYETTGGYGSSMGAYAAIRFAKLLNLRTVLALSPQFDVRQEWDRRWQRADLNHDQFQPVAENDVSYSCRYHIAYDPLDQDALHSQRYLAILPSHQVSEIQVPYSGHPVGYHLNDVGALKNLALNVLSGRPTGSWKAHATLPNGASSRYLSNLARKLERKGRFEWAASVSTKALSLKPLDAEIHILCASVARKMRRFDQAFLHASAAVILAPNHPHMTAVLAQILNSLGNKKMALYYIDTAIALDGGRDRLEYIKASIQESTA